MGVYEEMVKEIDEWSKKRIEDGYYGEEIEAWEAREPKPSRRISLGCYEELQPLYEFLVNYTQRCHDAGQTLPFDASRLDKYAKYINLMYREASGDFRFSAFSFGVACQTVHEMVKQEITYHKGMEYLVSNLPNALLPNNIKTDRAYTGQHLDALVSRNHKRYSDWCEEGDRIAAENVRKRGEQGG